MSIRKTVLYLVLLALGLLAACDAPELRKSDAELGLNPKQAAGRRIFDRQCGLCHAAYSSRKYKGPSLQALFKKPYLTIGAPANSDRVRDIIVLGHGKMPSYGRVLNDTQIDELIAYLHTL